MIGDLRHAVRMLLQAKGWTAVVVVSLALGIGANTALFSAINGLLLKKLPVSDPDALVRLRYAGPNQVRTDIQVYGYTAPDARGRQIGPPSRIRCTCSSSPTTARCRISLPARRSAA